jgi:hypothetical protein
MVSVVETCYDFHMSKPACTQCKSVIDRKIYPRTVRPFCDSTCYGAWQTGRKFSQQGKPQRQPRACSVVGCGSAHFGKGYCRKHYLKLAYVPPTGGPKRTPANTHRCKHCGVEFVAVHASPQFCSSGCSGAHRRKPFILKKGYKKLLIPLHPRSDAKGYVFEHIVISEAMIGRPLERGEEVHHIDFNRQNNAPSNLQICKSHAEHMQHHITPSCSSE